MIRISSKLHVLFAVCLACAALSVGPFADAQEYRVGDIKIIDPHTRATPPGARTAAGFMTIQNSGTSGDRLYRVSAEFAEVTEIHKMSMNGGMMKMEAIEEGLIIPAGSRVQLQSGGFHIMFMQIVAQLEKGTDVMVTLSFEQAGNITIKFPVLATGG